MQFREWSQGGKASQLHNKNYSLRLYQYCYFFLDDKNKIRTSIIKFGIEKKEKMEETGFIIHLINSKLKIVVNTKGRRHILSEDFKFNHKETQHFVMTWHKTEGLQMFSNGQKKGQQNIVDDHSVVLTNSSYFSFLKTDYPHYSEFGKLEDVSIWKRKLSDKEIEVLYKEGSCEQYCI